jgi:hypothetical protein
MRQRGVRDFGRAGVRGNPVCWVRNGRVAAPAVAVFGLRLPSCERPVPIGW